MPRYRIHRNFGYVGTHDFDEIEAATDEKAEQEAEDFAMHQVEWWIEKLEDQND